MSAALESRAQVLRLARLLDADPERLSGLEAAGPEALRRLRDQISDALFASGMAGLERAAALGGLLPAPLVSQLAQRALGPQLAARTAALLDADRAIDLAGHLPLAFLAELAVSIDPRRLREVIASLPVERLIEVGDELTRREEWVVMGSVVDHLPDATLEAALDALDDEAVLRVGFVLDNKARLDEILGHLDDQRIASVISVAAREGLWLEAIDLALNAREERARVVGIMGRAPEAELDSLGDALVADPDLAAAAQQLEGELPAPARERVRRRVQEARR